MSVIWKLIAICTLYSICNWSIINRHSQRIWLLLVFVCVNSIDFAVFERGGQHEDEEREMKLVHSYEMATGCFSKFIVQLHAWLM